MRRLLILLCLVACPPARANDRQLVSTAERFCEGRSDQGEVALALWAWRLEEGDAARERVTDAICGDEVGALLDALIDPPPLPAISSSIDDTPLATLLVAPAGETVLERAVRSARFTRALDRVPLSVALGTLDPAHPWVVDVRERARRGELALHGLVRLFDALALPIDPRTSERVRLKWLDADRWQDDLWGGEGKTAGGWVLERDAEYLTILDDRLQRRRVAVSRVTPLDVDEELTRWAVARGVSSCTPGRDAVALRAWWALRRGRVWTAIRLTERLSFEFASAQLRWSALDFAKSLEVGALVDLGLRRSRAEAASALRRALAVLDLTSDTATWNRRSELASLAARLAAQDAMLRVAPPLPTWSEWQRLSVEERVPLLIRALPDCDGDPTEASPDQVTGASQRVPLDAPSVTVRPEPHWPDGEAPWSFRRPSGWSAADQLVEIGEPAIPALIEVLSDPAPTRCVTSSSGGRPDRLLTVGECALRILRAIVDSREESSAFESSCWQLNRRELAREWWERVNGRGGLVVVKMASVLQGLERCGSSRSVERSIRWLVRHGGGREVELLRALVVAERGHVDRANVLRWLGRAPHDGYDALLVAELGSDDDRVAMAAASALVDRGDRRGISRALERATDRGAPDDDVILALDVLSRPAAMQDLAAVAFRVVDRPACDEAVRLALVDAPASAERMFALARIAARPRELPPVSPWGDDPPARLAIEALVPVPVGGRACVAPSERPPIIVDTLARALRLRADPDALEHAAVTCCLLGADAMEALAAASGHDLRPPLLGALALRDPPRRVAAVAALDRLGRAELRWLIHDATRVPLDVSEALARASVQVVRVTVAPGAPDTVKAALEAWLDQDLDLDRVSDVLEAWENADESDAFELVIARPACGGVRVSATCPAAGPDAVGWLLRVEAHGAGITLESATTHGLPPSCRSTHVLGRVQNALQNALVDHPDGAARIVIRAER